MRRALAWVAVLLVVLGGGYLGDNALRGYAENRVAEAISAELGAEAHPSVSLGGFPFSLALVTRSVPQAHLSIRAMPLEISDELVELTGLSADLGAIRLDGDMVRIASVTGNATLGYSDLAKIAGVPITNAGDGRLQLRYTRNLFGRELTFAVSALPKLDSEAQVVRLTDAKLDLAGNDIDLNLTQDQLDGIVEPINVQLDHDLRLTSLLPGGEGVAVGVAGADLSVPVP